MLREGAIAFRLWAPGSGLAKSLTALPMFSSSRRVWEVYASWSGGKWLVVVAGCEEERTASFVACDFSARRQTCLLHKGVRQVYISAEVLVPAECEGAEWSRLHVHVNCSRNCLVLIKPSSLGDFCVLSDYLFGCYTTVSRPHIIFPAPNQFS